MRDYEKWKIWVKAEKQRKEEEEKAKKPLSSGDGDPVRRDPPSVFIPGGTSGSGTVWFNPPKPKVTITDM
jgi:hypothetical protein